MNLSTPALLLSALCLALASTDASAGKVVLTPLLGDSTVDDQEIMAVWRAMAGELDMNKSVDELISIAKTPLSLNEGCLDSPGCLRGIAVANEGTQVMTGAMSKDGADYKLDLVFFNGKSKQRRQYAVPADPSILSLVVRPAIDEMLASSAAETAARKSLATDGLGDAPETELAALKGQRALLAEQRARASDDNGPATPTEQPSKPVSIPRPAAPKPAAIATATTPAIPQRKKPKAADEKETSKSSKVDAQPPAKTRSQAKVAKTAQPENSKPKLRTQVTGRAGFTQFSTLGFATAGLELGVPTVGGLLVVAGFESYAVQLNENQMWASILPVNAGLLYKFRAKAFEPYVGADAVAVEYYRTPDEGGSWAVGGRLRLGMDVMMSRSIGLNLNVPIGYWTGQDWALIKGDASPGGVVVGGNGGMVVRF